MYKKAPKFQTKLTCKLFSESE